MMFSTALEATLDREVVGQTAAVHSVVRGVTRVTSGLTPRERRWCAYLFMGPSGTGKTQLVQTLARTLHGDGRGLFIADCTHFVHADPWSAFAGQFAPMFTTPRQEGGGAILEAAPLSILLVEYLERGRKEISKALTASLETGRLALPGGRLGSLKNCLVFLTTSLCSREILEEGPRIGFSGSPDEAASPEEERMVRACRAEAVEQFGEDLVGRLDALLVFHRLREEDLARILDRRFARMNAWLATRGFQCRLEPSAKAFLLEKGRSDLRLGARELVRAHRKFLEFPIGDLLISGRIPPGSRVVIDRREDQHHLHFTVERAGGAALDGPFRSPTDAHEIPVAWVAESGHATSSSTFRNFS